MGEWFFPVGSPRAQTPLNAFRIEAELDKAAATAFSGYFVVLAHWQNALCEGLLLFESGRVIGCAFESIADSRQAWGEDALTDVFRLFQAPAGIVDTVHLSLPQVGLIPAFYSAIRLNAFRLPKDLIKQIPTKYDGKGGNVAHKAPASREPTRFELFAKRGLSDLHKD